MRVEESRTTNHARAEDGVSMPPAVFGFGGIAAGATQIAKILFFLFLILFVVSLIMGVLRGRVPKV